MGVPVRHAATSLRGPAEKARSASRVARCYMKRQGKGSATFQDLQRALDTTDPKAWFAEEGFNRVHNADQLDDALVSTPYWDEIEGSQPNLSRRGNRILAALEDKVVEVPDAVRRFGDRKRVTLYRGMSDEEFEDVLKGRIEGTGRSPIDQWGATGKYFTDDPSYAERYGRVAAFQFEGSVAGYVSDYSVIDAFLGNFMVADKGDARALFRGFDGVYGEERWGQGTTYMLWNLKTLQLAPEETVRQNPGLEIDRTAGRKTIPCGRCFEWAVQQAKGDYKDAKTIVHGTVTEPFSNPPHKYKHAWVEHRGKVYDWQTMEAGHGGKYRGKGYPLREFYDLYEPEKMTRYTSTEAVANTLRNGHYGPWT